MRALVFRAGLLVPVAGLLLLAQACSGDDSATAVDAGKPDGSTADTGAVNGSVPVNATAPGNDAGLGDAGAPDGTCTGAWVAAPTVDPSIAPEAGTVLFHAAATGTQNYECEQTADAGGVYQWVFLGPEANLYDCNAALLGQHLASDAGPTAPEWITVNDSYVIAKKLSQFVPDGGAGSVPWLLLQETSTGGTGIIAMTQQVNRLNTDGGNAPDAAACDVGNTGTVSKEPYSADYYFYH